LRRWAMEVAKRRGARRAKVALARKLAVVLHRVGGTASDGWTAPSSAGARSRQRPRPDPVGRRAKEGDKIGVGQTGARSPEVPSPGRGNGEAAGRGVALPTGGDHAVPRSVESWVRPDGQRPIWSLPGLRRRAGFGVDGTYAQHSAERRGQAPQPRSGAPEAPGLRAALLGRGRLARATRPP
jgi:hypothetical protein